MRTEPDRVCSPERTILNLSNFICHKYSLNSCLMSFYFDKQPQLLVTYDAEWSVSVKESDGDLVALRSVIDYLVESTERTFERHILLQNIEMYTKFAHEIVHEIVEYVVSQTRAPALPPSPSSVLISQHQEEAIQEPTKVPVPITNDATEKTAEPMELSQDIPCRNLEEELADDFHQPNSDSGILNESSAEFEELWIKKKCDVEKCAEGRAKALFRQWQRDRTTLEQAIDASLKEYAEMYEKAHALRLMFEEEKSQWSRKIMQVHTEDTPYGDLKRRRCDSEYAPSQPAWPYPQRQSLDHEFQYTVDESQDQDGWYTRAEISSTVVGDVGDGSIVISPQRRQAKRFTVPVKHVSEE